MKAAKACITLLIFLSQFVQAQEIEEKLQLTITGGASVPTSRFANPNYDVNTLEKPNGLAKNGYGIDATLHYRHRDQFGFSLLIGYSSNKQELSDFEEKTRPGYYSEISRTDIIEKNWKIFKAMPGIYIEAPLSPESRFIIQPVLSAGICKAEKPEEAVYYYSPDGEMFASTQNDKVSLPLSFCFQAGMNVRYTISNKISALLGANYFSATPAQKVSYQNDSGNTVTATAKYNLSSINAMVGIGITL